jgi:hypothetical protein
MTFLNISMGFDIFSENPKLALTGEKGVFGLEVERVHGVHPFTVGKMNKAQIISLRNFLNEVLHEKA